MDSLLTGFRGAPHFVSYDDRFGRYIEASLRLVEKSTLIGGRSMPSTASKQTCLEKRHYASLRPCPDGNLNSACGVNEAGGAPMRLSLGILLTFGVVAGSWFSSTHHLEAGGGGPCHEPLTEGKVSEVAIFENCFGPTVARVAVGDTVTWTNHDSVQHNVYPPGQGWSDGHPLYKSNTTRAIFEAAGVHPYICSVHPGMVGVVVVGDGASETAAPYLAVQSAEPSEAAQAVVASAHNEAADDSSAAVAVAGLAAGAASVVGLAVVGLVVARRR